VSERVGSLLLRLTSSSSLRTDSGRLNVTGLFKVTHKNSYSQGLYIHINEIITKVRISMKTRYEVTLQGLNDVRLTILLKGPIWGYAIGKALGPRTSLATIDRRLKILVGTEEVKVYRTEEYKSGRKKKFYGLTLYGFLRSFRIPGQIARKNFKSVMRIWLQEKRFEFFLPKREVLEALNYSEVDVNLSKLCVMVAKSLPEAEDLLDYLEDVGYDKFGPSQVVDLAMGFAGGRYGQEFVAMSKILCKHLPTYRERIRRFIQTQRTRLDSMEKYIFGDLKREET